MTHLKIEQNNGVIEEVSSAVIDKLYDIVHSGNLDNTSNLIGRLHTTATYQDYIDYLEDTFKVNGVKQLIIDATKKYLTFADPVVRNYWANSTYGDGTGIDITSAASVLNIPNSAFKNNTSIETFDELGTYFPNCTTINQDAFSGCSNLTSIDLSNITTVNRGAFQNCTKLESLDFTSNLTTLGRECFAGCSSLKCIDLSGVTLDSYAQFNACTSLIDLSTNDPDQASTNAATYTFNWTSIPGNTFNNCKLTNKSFSFPNATTVGNNAFNGTEIIGIDLPNVSSLQDSSCFVGTKLTGTLNLPKLTSVGRYPFEGCTLLEEVNIGADVPVGSKIKGLGQSMFSGCTSLQKVTGLSEITYVNSGSFNGCTNLTEVDISDECTGIVYEQSFINCSSLKCVNISKASAINYRAFQNCTNLLDLDTSDPTQASSAEKTTVLDVAGTIGATAFQGTKLTNKIINIVNVTILGSGVFESTEIKEVYAPNCTTLSDNAFKNCSNLVKVTIDGSTSIGIRAFQNCTNLQNLTVLSTTPGTLNTTAFEGASNCIIYVPASAVSDYQNASGWSNYASRIQAIPT